MTTKPSAHEPSVNTKEQIGVPCMELTKAQELIRQMKTIKESNEITYPRIIERMEKNGRVVSLTTLRRVFAEGSEANAANFSEANAANFSYENTLMPIAEVLLNVEDVPTPEDAPNAQQIEALKAVVHCQNEEIARLHELKEHLENRISFLLEQIEKKDRRMDEKDDIIRKLMDKCL